MPYDDLREFLAVLEKEGQLLRITEEVMPEPDLGAAGRAVNNLGEKSPALLFERINGFDNARVALNVHGSWPNHALMMGLPKDTQLRDQVEELARRWKAFPVPVERRTSAPWQEITIEKDINLYELLPVFRLNAADGGPFIDKACIVSRDPDAPHDFGKQNVGIYRLQVKGPDRLGIQTVPFHDIGRHILAAERRGENLPVAIAVGNDPVISLTGGMPLEYGQSEYEMAGALRGGPYPIVSAPLTGLDVPWGAEVVIEAQVIAGTREYEGPFGEFTGHYSGGKGLPYVKVHRVHMRPDTIFEHLYIGLPWTEFDYMLGPNTCVPILEQLRVEFPEVVAVNAMYTHGLVTIVSTKLRTAGFGKTVGLRTITTPHGIGYCKVVIVVDDFVDPFDLRQVMWALSTKLNPEYDLVTVPRMYEVPLDPSSEPPGITTRLILDATTPVKPDNRGAHGQLVAPPPNTGKWERILREMLA